MIYSRLQLMQAAYNKILRSLSLSSTPLRQQQQQPPREEEMGTNIFSQLTTATSFQSSSSISVNVWGPTMGCYIILLMVASQRRHVQQQGRPAGTNLHLFSVKRAGAHTAAAERNVCARIKSAGWLLGCYVRAPIFTCAIFAKINYAPPSGFPCYFFFVFFKSLKEPA
jgi:hypothetical protein